MKRRALVILTLALMPLLIIIPALADSWEYYVEISVSDNSSAGRTGVPVLIDIEGQNLIDAGYISDNATDTRIKEGTTERRYLITDERVALFIPSLAASQEREYRFYTGYSPTTDNFTMITGADGYITITDAAVLELGNNFGIEQKGWIDTSAGSDKNLVHKASAFRTYVSGASEITSAILGAGSPTNETLRPDGVGDYTNIINEAPSSEVHWTLVDEVSHDGGTTMVKQDDLGDTKDAYTLGATSIPADSTINSVTHYFTVAYGAIVCYATPHLRLGGNETAGTEVTLTSSWVTHNEALARPGGGSWEVGDLNDLQIVIGLRNASGGDRIAMCTQTYVVVNYTPNNAELVTATATSISSGEHTIKTTADGTDLKIFVDGVEEDSTALGGESVPNNDNNLTLMQNNSIAYMEYYKHTVSGTLITHYQPSTMISGTTLPDREGTAQNGTITWGSNSSLLVIIGSTTGYESTTSSAGEIGTVSDTIMPAGEPGGWYGAATNMENLPFYEQFNSAATGMGMTTQTLYVFTMLGVATAVGLSILLFTGSTLISAFGAGGVIAMGTGTTVLSQWMIYVFVVFAIGIIYLSRRA